MEELEIFFRNGLVVKVNVYRIHVTKHRDGSMSLDWTNADSKRLEYIDFNDVIAITSTDTADKDGDV